jgi:hypothetical protein
MDYTLQEKAELVLLQAGGLSQAEAAVKFHRRHPTRPQPQQGTVSKLFVKQ